MLINSEYTNISEPAQELPSRAMPSVGGNITTQSVQPQGEIMEEGRKKEKKINIMVWTGFASYYLFNNCGSLPGLGSGIGLALDSIVKKKAKTQIGIPMKHSFLTPCKKSKFYTKISTIY